MTCTGFRCGKAELYTSCSIGRIYMLMGKQDWRIRKCQKYL